MFAARAALRIIKTSPLFDAQWYLGTYPEVGRSRLDPAAHYLRVGGKAGWHPGPAFDAVAYLTCYPDVAAAGLNPLVHYERYGRREGRSIRPPGSALSAGPVFGGISEGHLPLPGAVAGAGSGAGTIFDAVRQTAEGTQPGLGFTRRPHPDAALHMADYTVVTPTGDRAAFFNRCLHMVTTQTLPPRQWVVVDDGETALSDQMQIPDWVTYIRRPRRADDPPHTLSVNMLAALEHVTQDRVLIMEDDDWYAPFYAEFMLPYLDTADLIGLNKIRYYHLRAGLWKTGTPPRHTAFAQSAFRRGHAWDHLAAVCRTNFTEIREKGVLDRHWWHTFEGKKHLIADHPCLHLGFKGVFGRAGLADGHRHREPDYIADPDLAYLTQSIGPDIVHYRRWQNLFRKPYALYTVVTPNGDLPNITGVDLRHFDLYAFSNAPLPKGSPWQAIPFDAHWDDPGAQIAKCRAMAHLYFPEHAWSLWVTPGRALPKDPGGLIADTIDRRASVALYATRALDAANSAQQDPAVLRDLKDREASGEPLYSSDIIVRQQENADVAAAMVMWCGYMNTAQGREGANSSLGPSLALSCALWRAGLKPALLA